MSSDAVADNPAHVRDPTVGKSMKKRRQRIATYAEALENAIKTLPSPRESFQAPGQVLIQAGSWSQIVIGPVMVFLAAYASSELQLDTILPDVQLTCGICIFCSGLYGTTVVY
eukprot:SAG11_NODE_12606_length_694_cov_5.218487_1_plen_112_part_10